MLLFWISFWLDEETFEEGWFNHCRSWLLCDRCTLLVCWCSLFSILQCASVVLLIQKIKTILWLWNRLASRRLSHWLVQPVDDGRSWPCTAVGAAGILDRLSVLSYEIPLWLGIRAWLWIRFACIVTCWSQSSSNLAHTWLRWDSWNPWFCHKWVIYENDALFSSICCWLWCLLARVGDRRHTWQSPLTLRIPTVEVLLQSFYHRSWSLQGASSEWFCNYWAVRPASWLCYRTLLLWCNHGWLPCECLWFRVFVLKRRMRLHFFLILSQFLIHRCIQSCRTDAGNFLKL